MKLNTFLLNLQQELNQQLQASAKGTAAVRFETKKFLTRINKVISDRLLTTTSEEVNDKNLDFLIQILKERAALIKSTEAEINTPANIFCQSVVEKLTKLNITKVALPSFECVSEANRFKKLEALAKLDWNKLDATFADLVDVLSQDESKNWNTFFDKNVFSDFIAITKDADMKQFANQSMEKRRAAAFIQIHKYKLEREKEAKSEGNLVYIQQRIFGAPDAKTKVAAAIQAKKFIITDCANNIEDFIAKNYHPNKDQPSRDAVTYAARQGRLGKLIDLASNQLHAENTNRKTL